MRYPCHALGESRKCWMSRSRANEQKPSKIALPSRHDEPKRAYRQAAMASELAPS